MNPKTLLFPLQPPLQPAAKQWTSQQPNRGLKPFSVLTDSSLKASVHLLSAAAHTSKLLCFQHRFPPGTHFAASAKQTENEKDSSGCAAAVIILLMGENIVAAAPPLRGVLSAFRILDSIAPDDQTTPDSESNHPEKISLTKRNEKNKIYLANN